MVIRAILFDLGGVLLRTEDPQPRQRLASRFGMTPAELYTLVFDSESAHLALLGKISTTEHWRTVQQGFGSLGCGDASREGRILGGRSAGS